MVKYAQQGSLLIGAEREVACTITMYLMFAGHNPFSSCTLPAIITKYRFPIRQCLLLYCRGVYEQNSITSMHSSRMCTARWLTYLGAGCMPREDACV